VETHRVELDRTEDGVVIVAVEGEHDIYTVSQLREQIDDAFRTGTAVVIDLSHATFLDSSILRVLLGARNQAEEHASGFAVALDRSKAPAVHRILEVTGLLEVFPVLPGRERAVEAARSAATR
jgi:anti-anti-sigma factor